MDTSHGYSLHVCWNRNLSGAVPYPCSNATASRRAACRSCRACFWRKSLSFGV